MLEKEKQVKDLIDSIKKINEQLNEFDRNKTIEVLLDTRNHLYVESYIYENTQGPTTDINYLDDYILQSKLMPYKIMCMKKLLDILGKEELDKIIKEKNL